MNQAIKQNQQPNADKKRSQLVFNANAPCSQCGEYAGASSRGLCKACEMVSQLSKKT